MYLVVRGDNEGEHHSGPPKFMWVILLPQDTPSMKAHQPRALLPSETLFPPLFHGTFEAVGCLRM